MRLFFFRHIFTEAMFRNGILDGTMYNLLTEWYDFILRANPIKVDHIGNKKKKITNISEMKNI